MKLAPISRGIWLKLRLNGHGTIPRCYVWVQRRLSLGPGHIAPQQAVGSGSLQGSPFYMGSRVATQKISAAVSHNGLGLHGDRFSTAGSQFGPSPTIWCLPRRLPRPVGSCCRRCRAQCRNRSWDPRLARVGCPSLEHSSREAAVVILRFSPVVFQSRTRVSAPQSASPQLGGYTSMVPMKSSLRVKARA